MEMVEPKRTIKGQSADTKIQDDARRRILFNCVKVVSDGKLVIHVDVQFASLQPSLADSVIQGHRAAKCALPAPGEYGCMSIL